MDIDAIWRRVQRAVKLEPGVYDEIADDPQATGQAFLLSIIATAIAGLGAIWPGGVRFNVVSWIIGSILGGIIGLVLGAGILWLVSRLFKAQGDYVQLLRALGYAQTPRALGIIPVIGTLAGWIWSLILTVRAVRESQDVSEGAAWAIVLIPAAIGLLVGVLVFAAFVATMLGFASAE